MITSHRQKGIALLVSLVLLLLLTIIAITAASLSTLQLRMASNSQQQNIAFQAAESGLQAWIEELTESNNAIIDETRTLGLANADSGTIARVRIQSVPAICTDAGTSLNAAEGGGAQEFICYEITSHGKACDSDSCDPTSADGSARAQHLRGYKIRNIL
ncbi:PilX N-terminal domain-containing pilus assembly protein [Pseudomonas sp. WS 5011]|uniref:pilus assembly PilX family protein n=1 Tax=Pseudomonas sp. WS 5011 TaxID=2717477 RepID=UPI00147398FB|nr:PilX N-terminal domain-containing pilus assembly protein [Pseudomonas sp. WS 5011]NMY53099.1 hypothetical protein [Pseudomonas sp. WS 5011]